MIRFDVYFRQHYFMDMVGCQITFFKSLTKKIFIPFMHKFGFNKK